MLDHDEAADEGGLGGYHRAQMRTATTAIAKAMDSQLAEYISRFGIGCPVAAVTRPTADEAAALLDRLS